MRDEQGTERLNRHHISITKHLDLIDELIRLMVRDTLGNKPSLRVASKVLLAATERLQTIAKNGDSDV